MKIPRYALAAFAAISLLSLTALAADPSGTWKWSSTGPNGNTFETTLTLALKNGVLTGTYSNQFGDAKISHASFNDDTVAFEVDRQINGNEFDIKFRGKLKAGTITGTLELPDMGNGPSQIDWVAHRAK